MQLQNEVVVSWSIAWMQGREEGLPGSTGRAVESFTILSADVADMSGRALGTHMPNRMTSFPVQAGSLKSSQLSIFFSRRGNKTDLVPRATH